MNIPRIRFLPSFVLQTLLSYDLLLTYFRYLRYTDEPVLLKYDIAVALEVG